MTEPLNLAEAEERARSVPWIGFETEEHALARDVLALAAAYREAVEALKVLHDETADYITINHLGDPHHNQSMKTARAVLAKARTAGVTK